MGLSALMRIQAREHAEPKQLQRISDKPTKMYEPSKVMCTSFHQPRTVASRWIEERASHPKICRHPPGKGNDAKPVSMCLVQHYCSICCARNLSRLARSRFHGRMGSLTASGSKAEPFEEGDKLRGEAVDNEDDALKRLSRGRLNVVDTDDQLVAAERLGGA